MTSPNTCTRLHSYTFTSVCGIDQYTTIVHKSGKSNSIADALSRIPYHSEEDHGGQIPNQQVLVCSEVGLQSSVAISNPSVSHASPENKFGVNESSDSAVSLHQPARVSNSETETSDFFPFSHT